MSMYIYFMYHDETEINNNNKKKKMLAGFLITEELLRVNQSLFGMN